MSDTFDDDPQLLTPAEGVRILGAEEVSGAVPSAVPADHGVGGPHAGPAGRAASDAGSASAGSWSALQGRPSLESEDEDSPSPELPWSVGEPGAGHPDDLLPGHEPARAAAVPPPAYASAAEPPPTPERAEPSTGEIPPLPHWTEPPTGAVPAIFADDADDDDESVGDADAWATVSGAQPRFRAEGSDWAESDFSEELSGEPVKLGALAEEAPVDEEAAFARDLAARRRGRGARSATARRPARAPKRERVRPEAEPLPAREAPARDLPTAIITGAAVAVVAIVCFMQGTAWTVALAALVVGTATLELATTLQRRGIRPATPVALAASTLIPIAARHYGTGAYPVFFALVVVVSMLWFLWEITPGRPLAGVAATVLLFAYVGGLGGFAGLLLASRNGVGLLFGVAICVIAYDVFGFFVGSQFGRNAVAPHVSPNKTIEGTVGGMIASIVAGVAIAGQVGPWTTSKGFVLGVLVAVGAFTGDLCESMLKRDLGVKDFGSVLPGHGGVLDRFDSLLFCLPIAFYLALQFKIF